MIRVYYHQDDLDGMCSAAICKYKFPDAVLHGMSYGNPFPREEIKEDDEIYMVDFALQPWSDMERLFASVPTHWIDHHSGAILAYNRHKEIREVLVSARTDVTKAACELTWEYLFPDRPVPLAVKLLSLYDSWTYQGHELENMVLPFQMRMRMENWNPSGNEINHIMGCWYNLFTGSGILDHAKWEIVPMNECIEEGRLLLRYDEANKAKYAKTYAFETKLITPKHWSDYNNRCGELAALGQRPSSLEGYKAIAVNLGHTNSKVFDKVAYGWWCDYCQMWIEPEDVRNDEVHDPRAGGCEGSVEVRAIYDLMITFVRRKDKLWNVSLYSTKPEIDCGEIAKSFGGGGHKGAAGFQCETLPFES